MSSEFFKDQLQCAMELSLLVLAGNGWSVLRLLFWKDTRVVLLPRDRGAYIYIILFHSPCLAILSTNPLFKNPTYGPVTAPLPFEDSAYPAGLLCTKTGFCTKFPQISQCRFCCEVHVRRKGLVVFSRSQLCLGWQRDIGNHRGGGSHLRFSM